jgi:hypothetical protein
MPAVNGRRTSFNAAQLLTARLARSEPLGAAQRAQRAVAVRDERIKGAVRETGRNPWPICAGKAGARVPLGADVKSHPSCGCIAVPVT